MKGRVKENAIRIGFWTSLILLWAIISYSGVATKLIVPEPHEVLVSFSTIFSEQGVWGYPKVSAWVHLVTTFRRVTLGFSIGAVIGIPLGILCGKLRLMEATFGSLLSSLRSIPVTSLSSLFLLIFGMGEEMRVAMVAYICLVFISIGAVEGMKSIEKTIVEAAYLDGADDWKIIQYLYPLALPHIYVGIVTSVSVSMIVTLYTEQLGSWGMGAAIYNSHMGYRIPEMYALIILIGLISLVLDRLFKLMKPRLIDWMEW